METEHGPSGAALGIAQDQAHSDRPARVMSWPAVILVGVGAPLLIWFFSLVLVMLFIAIRARLGGHDATRFTAADLIAMEVLKGLLLVLLAWRLARSRSGSTKKWLRLTRPQLRFSEVALVLASAFGAFALGLLVVALGIRFGVPSLARHQLDQVFRSAPGLTSVLVAGAMGLGPGVSEELWFRGHVLRILESRGTGVAIVGSALLFAACHLAPMAVLFAVPFGLFAAWLAVRVGSVLPGMLCHFAWNSGSVLGREILLHGRARELGRPVVHAGDFLLPICGVLLGLIAFILLDQRLPPAPGGETGTGPGGAD
jgi:membrane protease YdiL (CAAX protease family)